MDNKDPTFIEVIDVMIYIIKRAIVRGAVKEFSHPPPH